MDNDTFTSANTEDPSSEDEFGYRGVSSSPTYSIGARSSRFGPTNINDLPPNSAGFVTPNGFEQDALYTSSILVPFDHLSLSEQLDREWAAQFNPDADAESDAHIPATPSVVHEGMGNNHEPMNMVPDLYIHNDVVNSNDAYDQSNDTNSHDGILSEFLPNTPSSSNAPTIFPVEDQFQTVFSDLEEESHVPDAAVSHLPEETEALPEVSAQSLQLSSEPSKQIAYTITASTFTCPLRGCRQQITYFGFLEEDRIRAHVFNDCSDSMVRVLIEQSYDEGKKIRRGILDPKRLQCPLRNCKSRFSAPEKWVKHLTEKHPGPPIFT